MPVNIIDMCERVRRRERARARTYMCAYVCWSSVCMLVCVVRGGEEKDVRSINLCDACIHSFNCVDEMSISSYFFHYI